MPGGGGCPSLLVMVATAHSRPRAKKEKRSRGDKSLNCRCAQHQGGWYGGRERERQINGFQQAIGAGGLIAIKRALTGF